MTLSTSHRQPLADEITEKIRAMVHSGEWPLQQRIPSETELMASLGVSRGTLREAIKALAHGGMLEVRVGLDTQAARLAARHATPDDVAALRALLADRDASWKAADYAAWARADWGFHDRVAQASANPLLHELYASFGEVFHNELLKQHRRPGFQGLAHEGHGALIDAIEAHDEEAAVLSVTRNLHSCAEWLRE
ncbi:MAG: GntR family transcriptional regulator [Arthrobacter sp.]|nr:GntR family transcriptional regulator [Arthrobacter sp.]